MAGHGRQGQNTALGKQKRCCIPDAPIACGPGDDACQCNRGCKNGDESDARGACPSVGLLKRQAGAEHRQIPRHVGSEKASQPQIACGIDKATDET